MTSTKNCLLGPLRVLRVRSACILRSIPLVLFGLMSFETLVFAEIPKRDSSEAFVQKDLEALKDDLKIKKAPKNFKIIRQAYDALRQEKFKRALALTSPLERDKILGDYALWISSAARLGNAKASVAKLSYDSAIQLARSSISETLRIEGDFPFSPFIKSIPKEIAKAELLMGDAYWGAKKWTSSQEYFERAFQRLLTHNSIFLIQLGHLSHYAETCKKKQSDSCIQWLQKFSSTYPKKSMEQRAILTQFPNIPEKTKVTRNGPRATITYKSPDLDQVAYDAAIKNYSDKKYSNAIKSFEQFLDEFPRSALRYRARYWLAQALMKKKEPEKAIKVYDTLLNETPLTYYGLLASKEAHRAVEAQIQASTPQASDFDASLSAQDQIRLQRAKNFLIDKAYPLAAIELKEIKTSDSLSSPFLLYLAMLNREARNYRHCFVIIGELFQRGYDGILSSSGLQMIFPEQQNFKLISEYSNRNSLDPILVLSLIKQESAFEEEALSAVGASGLMQLMPGTATDVDSEISLSDLRQPENNIRVGTTYLKKLLTRFNGNVILALAAYNAGPLAVDRWLKDFPPENNMFDFIESIPYKETREYVAAIVRNYYWYSKFLKTSQQGSDIEGFWKPLPPVDKKRTPSATADNNGSTPPILQINQPVEEVQ